MNSNTIEGIGAGTILRRNADGSYQAATDEVAIEEPLEIRIENQSVAITMRTPGCDEELAAGFLLSEAIVHRRADLSAVTAAGNVANVMLGPGANFIPGALQRFGAISSSCGLCGKTKIESIRQNFEPLSPKATPTPIKNVLAMPEQLRRAQKNFGRTGGIHAAGIFDESGNLMILREDIGRHNAVDKAIGRAFLDELVPLSNHVLLVSGRTSLEIVQKALAGGLAIVASVSAPSSLAINFAREANQTLIGFLRPPTFNLYSHIERLDLEASK